MSNQAILDYLTKQIFVEKNIVTYRLLSRQFSLHVNTAKNELATYHHNAPYISQNCSATFLISGRKKSGRSKHDGNEDVDMDQTPNSQNEFVLEEEDEESDSEAVHQVHMTLVEEKDLEAAKATYDEVHTVHVYSLAPSPLIDPALICDRTELVRQTDRTKGPEWASTVGRIVCDGIKVGPQKKGKRPTIPPQPVAGPSTSKQAAAPEPVTRSASIASEAKVKREPSIVSTEKGKEKLKPTGKLDFFAKAKESKEGKKPAEPKKIAKDHSAVGNKLFFPRPVEKTVEEPTGKAVEKNAKPVEPKKIVKEESVAGNKTFFSRPIEKPTGKTAEKDTGTTSVMSANSRKDVVKELASGTKRKLSIGPASRDSTPQSVSGGKKSSGTRVKGTMILSDDESDEVSVKPSKRRKSNIGYKSDDSLVMDSEAEREGRALMDIDDDEVEKVSHAPSTVVSELESEPESTNVKMEQDEDVHMEDVADASRRPQKKRKAKVAIPVGKNGLKKRKVTRTRTSKKNGYCMKEDYTDWESVEEEQSEPPTKTKSRPKTASQKEDTENGSKSPLPPSADAAETKKAAPLKPVAPKGKAKSAGNVKTQRGLMNFFGPTKKT